MQATMAVSMPRPYRRDLVGKRVAEKAAYLLPATEIKIHADDTATVSSPVSGTEYTIDDHGDCTCQAVGKCWHQEALRLYRERGGNVYATAPNYPAFTDLFPATADGLGHTILFRGVPTCPGCGNERESGWYARGCDLCAAWAAERGN